MKTLFISSLLFVAFASHAQKDSSKIIEPFIAVEQMPEFKGGEAAMMKFLSENLEYPPEAKNKNKEGKVLVRVTVAATGEIEHVTVISKEILGFGLEEAAVEVIKKMPAWTPGRQNGVAVPVYFNIPIRFRLF